MAVIRPGPGSGQGQAHRLLPDPLSTDRRQDDRHAVDFLMRGEHRLHKDFDLRVSNMSRAGFLATGADGLERGERLLVRLPLVGHRDAFVVWIFGERAGFQFERPIAPVELDRMLVRLRRG